MWGIVREAGEMLGKRAIKIERESRANERANGQEGRGKGGGESEKEILANRKQLRELNSNKLFGWRSIINL